VARNELGRVEGRCFYGMYLWGKPQAPTSRGNAEGAKLPVDMLLKRPAREASELKKSPSSLKKIWVMQISHGIQLTTIAYSHLLYQFLSYSAKEIA
jgi:hypothetical protein